MCTTTSEANDNSQNGDDVARPSVHETIVDEKLAPSGRDEERETKWKRDGPTRYTRRGHVQLGLRVCACMRLYARWCESARALSLSPSTESAGRREHEEERERKKGNRDTSDHGGDSLAHTLFCRKSSRTKSTGIKKKKKKDKYASRLCVRTSLSSVAVIFLSYLFLALSVKFFVCVRRVPSFGVRVSVQVHMRHSERTS